ncbi:hypothetical protein [Agromyces marinus]|uniref:Uncharacterized protein n=1 Tax=Agromyces marinus TaxID=1389020 RepID=A0ABN6YA75_9MICO|nr:hypothetical protein [Agromyces marinus]UIP57613.1 hypothetical protein DSM26151_04780 [Agromyces marinus]BDZ54235.1 hypothetical protein GCM10025870_13080 [Agromyces marinus]
MSDFRSRDDATTTTNARRAWVLGGGLLLASTVVGSVAAPALWGVPGSGFAGPALFSIALLVFAFGFRGAGSVTARRPLGTAALSLLAVWTFADGILLDLLPLESMSAAEQMLVSISDTVLTAALAAIACVRIGRAHVLPPPWNWAPCWALGAVIVPAVLQYLVFAFDAGSPDLRVATVLVGLDSLVRTIAAVFLGVVAIVLSTRSAGTRTVRILASEE